MILYCILFLELGVSLNFWFVFRFILLKVIFGAFLNFGKYNIFEIL